jgi:transposase
MHYIGIDAHKETRQATVMNEAGDIVERRKVPTRAADLKQFFRKYRGSKAVLESSTVWEFVYETVSGEGIEVILANPAQVKAISQARIKTDKVDSETLAHLLRTDMIPESYVARPEIRELRKDVRGRLHMKKTTSALMNQLYSEMIRRGIEYKEGALQTKKGREKLRRDLPVPRVLRRLDILEALLEEIDGYNKELLLPAYDANPKAQLLSTIRGVGYYTALTVVAEVGDFNRFPDSDSGVSFVGLDPGVRQSGNTVRMGPITKAGPHNLRWILVEAMYSHLRHCQAKDVCRLCNFYKKVRKRRGKEIAVVAGAAKMFRIMYWMVKLNQPYRPQGLDLANVLEGEPRSIE